MRHLRDRSRAKVGSRCWTSVRSVSSRALSARLRVNVARPDAMATRLRMIAAQPETMAARLRVIVARTEAITPRALAIVEVGTGIGLLLATSGAIAADTETHVPSSPRPSAGASSERTAKEVARAKQVATTLDEVRIEGEIAMPQVLFVTSYEQLRFASEAHRDDVLTFADVLQRLPWPGVPWALGSERPLTRGLSVSTGEK